PQEYSRQQRTRLLCGSSLLIESICSERALRSKGVDEDVLFFIFSQAYYSSHSRPFALFTCPGKLNQSHFQSPEWGYYFAQSLVRFVTRFISEAYRQCARNSFFFNENTHSTFANSIQLIDVELVKWVN